MKPIIVSSYVRNVDSNKPEINQVQSDDGIAKLTLIALAILLWKLTIPVLLIVGAVYGVTVIRRQPTPIKEVEAVIEPPRVKRSYHRRLTVNHYQTKTVRV